MDLDKLVGVVVSKFEKFLNDKIQSAMESVNTKLKNIDQKLEKIIANNAVCVNCNTKCQESEFLPPKKAKNNSDKVVQTDKKEVLNNEEKNLEKTKSLTVDNAEKNSVIVDIVKPIEITDNDKFFQAVSKHVLKKEISVIKYNVLVNRPGFYSVQVFCKNKEDKFDLIKNKWKLGVNKIFIREPESDLDKLLKGKLFRYAKTSYNADKVIIRGKTVFLDGLKYQWKWIPTFQLVKQKTIELSPNKISNYEDSDSD